MEGGVSRSTECRLTSWEEGIIIDHPMTRADYEDLSPAILVESPPRQHGVQPRRITGTRIRGGLHVNIVNWDGLIIADEVTATRTGTRGPSMHHPSKSTQPPGGS